jgi:hypothetical protein
VEPNDADCDPDSLRSRGWLQGCTLRLPLPLRHTAVVDGTVEEVVRTHDLWLIAEQDCDLAWRAVLREGAEQFLVELRPVFTDDPPVDWGIRSQRFLLSADDGRHLLATAPVVRVTPQVIVTAEHVACLDDDHQLRLKTWMGLRYDRPAVPQRYMKLARVLADALSVKKNRSRAERYRDVLAQYWDEDGVTKFTLVAVLPGGPHAANSNEVVDARAWLAESVRDVPAELGVAVSLDAYGDDTISLPYLEGSYGVDVTRLSWPPNKPGPTGAT